jgi:hypothetical protein
LYGYDVLAFSGASNMLKNKDKITKMTAKQFSKPKYHSVRLEIGLYESEHPP